MNNYWVDEEVAIRKGNYFSPVFNVKAMHSKMPLSFRFLQRFTIPGQQWDVRDTSSGCHIGETKM